MKRTINYTGRQKINKSDIHITLSKTQGATSFSASFSFANYDFPATAGISLEAYRQTTWKKYSGGTIGNPTAILNQELTEFGSPDGVLFRVKVTSTEPTPGLLLAVANSISPIDAQTTMHRSSSLLPVISKELDGRIWRLEFEGERPVLAISNRVPDRDSVAKDPSFMSVVYPEIFERILMQILHVERDGDTDGSDWCSLWLKYALQLPGVTTPPTNLTPENYEEIQEWISNVVDCFARQSDFESSFLRDWEGVGNENTPV